MRRADRMSRLGTENAFEVLAVVNRLVSEGRDIISFAIGEPDFDTPGNIKQAGVTAIQGNQTHYGPSAGVAPLRQAIADYMTRTRGFAVTPDEVVVTPGAKPIIFHGLLATVNEGDEVIYPNPGFPIYESVIKFIGAKAVPIPLLESRRFSFDSEQLRGLVTPRTRLIIINSPHNPTGGILTQSDLEAVAEIALANDLWVISDEIYSQIIYGGRMLSIAAIPEMRERTIIIDGFSKTYAMTGWRLGYGVMNPELARDVARLETNCESCTATFTQYAGMEALTGPQDGAESMARELRERKDLIVRGLNDIEGFRCLDPGGAFYVFPNVTGACRSLGLKDSKALQEFLLFEGGVAVLPRTSFGTRNAGEDQEYIRLSYATSKASIVAGLARIKKAIEG